MFCVFFWPLPVVIGTSKELETAKLLHTGKSFYL